MGGDEATLRAGSGTLLRQAISQMTGVDGTFTTFTSLVTNYSTTAVTNIAGLSNSTANSTNINATQTVPGPAVTINATDPTLNSPFRRRLQGCQPIALPNNGTVTVPVTTAGLNVQIPPSFFQANNATSPQDIAALVALIQAQLLASLGNQSIVATQLGGFVNAWATCTGMPPSTGVISDIGNPTPINVPVVPVMPEADDPMRIGVLAGVITGGIALMAIAALCVGGCGGTPANAHVCKATDVFGLAVRVPKNVAVVDVVDTGASLRARGARLAAAGSEVVWVRTCPHMTLRSAVVLALRNAGIPADIATVAGASVSVGDVVFTVAVHGASPLGALGIIAGQTVTLVLQ